MKNMKFAIILSIFTITIFSCGGKQSTSNAASNIKNATKKSAPVNQEPLPVCKLTMKDLIGRYANKGGFSAIIKASEKDSTKLDFVFHLSKGCVRKYSGVASKEEYFSVDEVNFMSRDTVNKIAIEISMFFSEGKLSVAERTSEKKEKRNDKCSFEGHLTKLK
jgi:hypothetical protein